MQLPISQKNALYTFYKSIPFLNTRIKNCFFISYHLLVNPVNIEKIPLLDREICVTAEKTAYTDEFVSIFSFSQDNIYQNYEKEIEWRAALSRGDLKAAKKAISEMCSIHSSYRTPSDPFRTYKNTLISVNAICKTIAADNAVDFPSIHKTYEAFCTAIEKTSNLLETEALCEKMLESYCNLIINAQTQKYSPVIQKTLAYIYMHYDEPIRLTTLAEYIPCSTDHLSRCFKKETGQTINHYINEFRIRQACSLLSTGHYSITETALLAGFSSYTRFSIEFKKYMGINASQYLASL